MANQTFNKVLLSGSTNGRGIKVVQTATAGTTIHTANATALDEVWLFAFNSHTADVELTIELGGTTAPDDNIVVTVPFDSGVMCVVPGLLVTGSVVVRAFAGTANVVVITGYVNRIS